MHNLEAELRLLHAVDLLNRWAQCPRALADVETHAIVRELLRRGLSNSVLSQREDLTPSLPATEDV